MLSLNALKTYLQNNGATPLAKLATVFNEDPKQIMLIAEHYIAKGKICCEQQTPSCASCYGCFAANLVKLSWVK